ncbi:O-antigen polymerase [Clostridium sp.]|uniref:O-antigen polymerase n=1 Tax=Clostridium sp. TaxID=1506 RepID=UPI0029115E15|nr:O-antigen polymerase [Clostridium sp.]MDU7215712.1 O-antigen polymerase [Clostridium sp.]
MNKVIANMLTIILIFLIIFIELFRKKDKGKLDILTGINLIYLFCFGIIQLIFINFDIRPKLNTINPNLASIDFDNDRYWLAALVSTIGYMFLVLGYFWNSAKKRKKNVCYKYEINYKNIKIAAIFSFFIGVFANLKYIILIGGGILEPIRISQDLRYNAVLESSGYIRILQPLIILSCMMYFVLYCEFKKKKFLLFTILTYIISCYYLLTYAGRLPLFLFLVTIPLYYMEKNKKMNLVNMSKIFVVGLLILIFGEYVFDLINGISNYSSFDFRTNIYRIIVQFSFPYINLLKVPVFVESGFRCFVDLFTWIINMIPSSILHLFGMNKVLASYQLNTNNFLSTEAGGVPVDILTLGYYQLSIVGVIIFTFIFGRIARYFKDITSYCADIPVVRLLKVRMFLFLSLCVMYADIDVIVKRRIEYWLFAIIILFSIKVLAKDDKN